MYFWNIGALTDELGRSSLPEDEAFKYLMASTVLYGLALIPLPGTNSLDVYSAIAEGAVALLGIVYVYRCNSGSDGRDFLQRYFSIGWVLGVRWLVLIVLPTLVVYFTVLESIAGIPDGTTVHEVVLVNSLYVAYFWRFGAYAKAVAGTQ